MSHLYNYFLNNTKKIIHKCDHYFPIYERHFSKFKNTPIKFLEIGVFKGGSLQMWKDYFGPESTIIGVDIDPACKAHEDLSNNIHVRIGDQKDPALLQSILNEFGSPDIVLDDGGHQMVDIISTFKYLHPKLHNTALYMVEDLCTAYWSEYGGHLPENFISASKQFIDDINAHHARGAQPGSYMTNTVFGVSFYDSIVCVENCPRYEYKITATGPHV